MSLGVMAVITWLMLLEFPGATGGLERAPLLGCHTNGAVSDMSLREDEERADGHMVWGLVHWITSC